MKKLITIVLVLVMLASILVLPAMASEIQPRYPVVVCKYCGGTAAFRYERDGLPYYECLDCHIVYADPKP